MEEAFFATPIYPKFACLDAHGRMPDESTVLRFRHRLKKHKLAEQILATVNDLLAAQGLLLNAGTAVDQTEKIKASIRATVLPAFQGAQAAVWIHQGALPRA